jgi:hypothetical protein
VLGLGIEEPVLEENATVATTLKLLPIAKRVILTGDHVHVVDMPMRDRSVDQE